MFNLIFSPEVINFLLGPPGTKCAPSSHEMTSSVSLRLIVRPALIRSNLNSLPLLLPPTVKILSLTLRDRLRTLAEPSEPIYQLFRIHFPETIHYTYLTSEIGEILFLFFIVIVIVIVVVVIVPAVALVKIVDVDAFINVSLRFT